MALSHLSRLTLGLSLTLSLCALPVIRQDGVVNSASQRPAGAGGAVQAGSLIVIHGAGFGQGTTGVEACWTQAGKRVALEVRSVSPDRIAAWLPETAPIGEGQVTVKAGGGWSAPRPLRVVVEAPGLFSRSGRGWGPADSENTPDAPSRRGLVVRLLATGKAASVRIGGADAPVVSRRMRPDRVIELAVRIPAAAPEGCHVPTVALSPSGVESNSVTLAVQETPGPCKKPGWDALAGWRPGKLAVFVLSRTASGKPASLGPVEDHVTAGFATATPASLERSPLLMAPPPGSCAAYGSAWDSGLPAGASFTGLLLDALGEDALDAGNELQVNNGNVLMRILHATGSAGVYQRMLKGGQPGRAPVPLMTLDGGSFEITGGGGRQVGAFRVGLPAPARFDWSNRAALTRIDKARPLAVSWAGAVSRIVAMVLLSASPEKQAVGLIHCTALSSAGHLSVPASLLAVLPSGKGEIRLISAGQSSRPASVPGVDHVVPLSVYIQAGEVQIR